LCIAGFINTIFLHIIYNKLLKNIIASIGIQGGKGSFSEQAAHEFSHNYGLEGADLNEMISRPVHDQFQDSEM